MQENAATLRGLRSEINIAPLVDVTMVLLIIFMAATPLLQAGYDVRLPRPAAGPAAEVLTVTLDATGGISLNGEPIERKDFARRMSDIQTNRTDHLVLFDGANEAGYADAIEVLDTIRSAGARIGVLLDRSATKTRE